MARRTEHSDSFAGELDYAQVFERNIGVFSSQQQDRLRASTILVAGNGGVGGPCAIALARMGVGRLLLADFDRYVPSNLNRQLPSTAADLGRAKCEVLAAHLRRIHPHTAVETFPEGISADNVDALVARSDLVVNAMDSAMFIELQRALKRQGKLGLTGGPVLHHVFLTAFPPGGHYFSDIYPFELDADDVQGSDRRYQAFLRALSGQRELFEDGRFPVVSPATLVAAGLVALHAAYFLCEGRLRLPGFPGHVALELGSLRSRRGGRTGQLFFALMRLLPWLRRIFVGSLRRQALAQQEGATMEQRR